MNTASQPFVSIVTPLYNEAEHLAECIESVLVQTYQNWDYTIVNNCSTDGSAEIAYYYAAKDSRIRVHNNQQFLRVMPNHNEALRQISPASAYCKIVFGDDWIFPECLERMVAVAEEHPSVGMVGAYTLEGKRVTCVGLPYSNVVVPGREMCRRVFLEDLRVWGSPNTVLYRSDLVRSQNRFFNEGNIHADTEACFALLRKCDFGFVHQVLTFTRVRPESLNAVATDLQTSLASMLHHLLTYGPDCLTPEELEICVKRHLAAYYEFLGKSLLLGRDRTFWNFHKNKLLEAGVGFSMSRVIWGALARLCNAALTPGDTVAKLRRRREMPILRQSSRFSIHQQEIR